MSTTRLEAFSDNVFGVAITILAFDVRLPVVATPLTNRELLPALIALTPKLYTYALSFILIGMFWVAHHRTFQTIHSADRPLQWLNINFLLWICLLPFSASTLGNYLGMRAAVIMYGGNLLLIGFSLYALYSYACKANLLEKSVTPELIKVVKKRMLMGVPIYLMGIALAFFNPECSTFVYLFALLIYLIPGKVDQHFKEYN